MKTFRKNTNVSILQELVMDSVEEWRMVAVIVTMHVTLWVIVAMTKLNFAEMNLLQDLVWTVLSFGGICLNRVYSVLYKEMLLLCRLTVNN